jgi:hypothetical protein
VGQEYPSGCLQLDVSIAPEADLRPMAFRLPVATLS